MLFPERDVETLLGRLTDHFGAGELIFDALAPWVTKFTDGIHWGIDDGRMVERMNPRLRLVEEIPLTAHYGRMSNWRHRFAFRMLNAFPVSRNMARQLRFEF
jgi:hypothetical protein